MSYVIFSLLLACISKYKTIYIFVFMATYFHIFILILYVCILMFVYDITYFLISILS